MQNYVSFDRFEKTIRTILETFGPSAISDGKRLSASFFDMAPSLKREKTLLTALVKCEGNRVLLEACSRPVSEQLSCLSVVVQKMVDQNCFDIRIAGAFCNAFLHGLGGTATITQNETRHDSFSAISPEATTPTSRQSVQGPNIYKNDHDALFEAVPKKPKRRLAVYIGIVVFVAAAILLAILWPRLHAKQSSQEEGLSVQASTSATPYEEYYGICVDYLEKYGEPSFPETGWWQYMHGLCLVRLLDFDRDGIDELLLCYATTDDPVNASSYVCEVWGYLNNQLTRLLQISEFNTTITWNGSWPIWVSVGSYNGQYCLMTTEDMSNKSIFLLDDGSFQRMDLEITYLGDLMIGADLDQFERTYKLNGRPVNNNDFELTSFLNCIEGQYIIYEIKNGTGSAITAIGGDELIAFTKDNIQRIKEFSEQ